jgi:TatD DNase family protein
MIDTHCHIDQFPDPEGVAREAEALGVFTVAVTNLPSHFDMAARHLRGFKFVMPALGLHPLAAEYHQAELPLFLRLVEKADWIGEIGLDFSSAGLKTKHIQLNSFEAILPAIASRKRFITLHSRRSEREVLDMLRNHSLGPVVFHWFSGSASVLKEIIADGHSLSFNTAMAGANRWREDFALVPRDRMLTETDGPHTKIDGEPSVPSMVYGVLTWFAERLQCSVSQAESMVSENMRRLTTAM